MIEVEHSRTVCNRCGTEWAHPTDPNDLVGFAPLMADVVHHLLIVHREPFYAAGVLVTFASSYLDDDEPIYRMVQRAAGNTTAALAAITAEGDRAYSRAVDDDLHGPRDG